MNDEERDLLTRYIHNNYNNIQLFNNIVGVINNQDNLISDVINRRLIRRNRRNNRNNENISENNERSQSIINEQQDQIRALETRLSQLENESNNRSNYIPYRRRNSLDRIFRDYARSANLNNFTMSPDNIFRNFNFESVRVRPTQQQISEATETLPFNQIANPLNHRCPITLIPFGNNQNVIRIRHCQHIFDSNGINEWFSNSVRCPVCRYDIREHNNLSQPNNNESRQPNGSITNIAEAIRQDIINQINNMDTSGNLTVEYSFITPDTRTTPIRVRNGERGVTWSPVTQSETEDRE
tara:strand:- start:13118 stop:14008 length:891 start_codon:yes stop_codon:yes gene_type:complete